MASLGERFDANQYEEVSFDPIPAGEYVAVITESDMKPNQAGTGEYLELVFEIIEGEHQGRKLWLRLNLDHPNDQAVLIAKGQLSAICKAVGVMTPQDSEELHDIPLIIDVQVRKRKDTGELTNEIRKFKPRAAAKSEEDAKPWKSW